MFKHLLATTALCLIGSTASAQFAFSHGDVSLGAYGFTNSPGIYGFELAARGDYDIGSLGLQLDGTFDYLTDFSSSISSSALEAHVYKELASGHKVGAYFGAGRFAFASDYIGFTGIEGMFDLGAVDVEASLGALYVFGGGSAIGDASLYAFYEISPSFEVSAGIRGLFDSSFTEATAALGAQYNIPNSDFAVSGYVSTPVGGGGFSAHTVVGLQVTYSLGNNNGERLFNSHNVTYYNLTHP